MLDRTRKLWDTQHRAVGDRRKLFDGVAAVVNASAVLYPGSYVDLTPAFVWPAVTFVDNDKRANQFFADTGGVDELIRENGTDPGSRSIRFIHADYREPLGVEDEIFDLLISLYAGFVSEHCSRYLRVGGHLLVNGSHGDAAMASIDPRFELRAVVKPAATGHRVTTDDLDTYMVPKKDIDITVAHLHSTGRGIAYTKPAFAYLFERGA